MGNCLVTKLKEVVNDDSLRRLGYIKLKIVNLDNFELVYSNSEATVVYLTGLTKEGSNQVILAANQLLYLSQDISTIIADDAYIEVYKYGKITSFATRSIDIDVDELNYTVLPIGCYLGNGAESMSYGSVKGSLDSIYNAILAAGADIDNVNGVYIGVDTRELNSDFVGDVTNIGKDFKIKRLSMYNQSGLTGSLNNLGYSADTLQTINLPYGIGKNSVTLDIETFVAKARKEGITEKSLTLKYATYIHITFNGEEVILSTTDAELSWTANTITYNGVTINNSDIEN